MRPDALKEISVIAGNMAKIMTNDEDLRNALAACADGGDNAWDIIGRGGLYLIATYFIV